MIKKGLILAIVVISILITLLFFYAFETYINYDTKSREILMAPPLGACQSLNSSNTVYILNASVYSNATCFTISADNVTLDCNGFEINYSADTEVNYEYGIIATYVNFTTIKNCKILEGQSMAQWNQAIYFLEVNNGTIDNNTIITLGDSSRGIHLSSSPSSNISNNIITTSNNASHGIFLSLNSSNNILFNNTINISGTDSYGISLFSRNNIIFNNIITTSNINGDGINLASSPNNNISSNMITTLNNYGYGISLTLSPNNRIFNNAINTSGNSSYGIYLSQSSTNNISNNIITTSNNALYGIFLSSSPNNRIFNNAINTSGAGAYGIYLASSSSNNISSNLVKTSNTNGDGITLSSSPNNNISSNIIAASNNNGYGISLISSPNNYIFNNAINTSGTGGYGISLASSSSNNISNNIVITSGINSRGVSLSSRSTNNSFSRMNIIITQNSSYAVYIYTAAHNFTMTDSILNSTSDSEFYITNTVTGGEWNFTNVSRTNSRFMRVNWSNWANGTLNYGWWLDGYANYVNGTLIVDSNVSAWDVNNILKFSVLTDNNGRIAQQLLLEYSKNRTTAVYYSNYIFNASNSIGFPNLTLSWNMTTNTDLVFTFAAAPPSPLDNPINPGGGGGGGGSTGGVLFKTYYFTEEQLGIGFWVSLAKNDRLIINHHTINYTFVLNNLMNTSAVLRKENMDFSINSSGLKIDFEDDGKDDANAIFDRILNNAAVLFFKKDSIDNAIPPGGDYNVPTGEINDSGNNPSDKKIKIKPIYIWIFVILGIILLIILIIILSLYFINKKKKKYKKNEIELYEKKLFTNKSKFNDYEEIKNVRMHLKQHKNRPF